MVITGETGIRIGQLRGIKRDNQWIRSVISLPVKRHVQIRAGKIFNEDTLASIHKSGAKWLSCYIQATGDVQTNPCQACTQAVGPFQDCILLNGCDLPLCGNCEWQKQRCSLSLQLRSGRTATSRKPPREPAQQMRKPYGNGALRAKSGLERLRYRQKKGIARFRNMTGGKHCVYNIQGPKLGTPGTPNVHHQLLTEDLDNGYSSADSYSEGKIEWRIKQVKTGKWSSNPSVVQYWHWIGKTQDGSEGDMFEHQVLNKDTWVVYEDNVDLHLRLAEITEIIFAANTEKLIIRTKFRGDVLAHFKRKTTTERFLEFLKNKQVKLEQGEP